MAHIHPIATLIPLAVGSCVVICTFFIHGLALSSTVKFVRHERQMGRAGVNFWTDFTIAATAMAITLVAHLIEIALWAALFILCGEFPNFATAYYHSAVNFTTLGYGDLIMSPSWKLLGPLEAADGMLMFGVSTAIIFTIIQRMVEARFVDLRN
jgi:hypothetical protein